MKKVLLFLVLAIALAACGNNATENGGGGSTPGEYDGLKESKYRAEKDGISQDVYVYTDDNKSGRIEKLRVEYAENLIAKIDNVTYASTGKANLLKGTLQVNGRTRDINIQGEDNATEILDAAKNNKFVPFSFTETTTYSKSQGVTSQTVTIVKNMLANDRIESVKVDNGILVAQTYFNFAYNATGSASKLYGTKDQLRGGVTYFIVDSGAKISKLTSDLNSQSFINIDDYGDTVDYLGLDKAFYNASSDGGAYGIKETVYYYTNSTESDRVEKVRILMMSGIVITAEVEYEGSVASRIVGTYEDPNNSQQFQITDAEQVQGMLLLIKNKQYIEINLR